MPNRIDYKIKGEIMKKEKVYYEPDYSIVDDVDSKRERIVPLLEDEGKRLYKIFSELTTEYIEIKGLINNCSLQDHVMYEYFYRNHYDYDIIDWVLREKAYRFLSRMISASEELRAFISECIDYKNPDFFICYCKNYDRMERSIFLYYSLIEELKQLYCLKNASFSLTEHEISFINHYDKVHKGEPTNVIEFLIDTTEEIYDDIDHMLWHYDTENY